MIKAVLFDFDGTLADTSESVILGYKTVFDKYAKDLKTDYNFFHSLLGPALLEIFPKYIKDVDVDILIKEYREACEPKMGKDYIKLYPKVIETFKALKEKNIKIGVFTSRSNKSATRLLKMLEIYDYIDIFIGFNDVNNFKPDPEGIYLALNKLNLKPNELMMVGDHAHDITASKEANIYSVGVRYSYYGSDKLKELGADFIVDDLYQIIDIIKKMEC